MTKRCDIYLYFYKIYTLLFIQFDYNFFDDFTFD